MRIHDNNSGVTITQVIGVILLLLIAWQGLGYALAFPTPYSLLTPSETEVWSEVVVIDGVSGQQFTFHSNINAGGDVNMVLGHRYDCVFKTNAPWRLDSPYRIAWRLDWYNTTSSNIETIQSEVFALGISAIWSDSWNRDLLVDNYQHNYWLVYDLYKPDGVSVVTHVVNFIPPP